MANKKSKGAARPKRSSRPGDRGSAAKSPGAGVARRDGAKAPRARQARSRPTAQEKAPSKTAPRETAEISATQPAHPAGEAAPRKERLFPIVGIGASAGGLEALEAFLRHVPEKSGMAFVVIQHLDPTHKGAMVELLQRATAMHVVQVEDRQTVEPDCVYVIPPNKDMSILQGILHLLPQASPRGLNLPIDYFFRSLAQDRQEGSIGVVLSGMGSDGTLGLRAIKEKAGATFVQSLTSAKFEGMPRSVIDSGLADVVAPAEELPAKIVAYHRHAPYIAKPEVDLEERHQSALEKVFILLRNQCGNDFSLYKRSTVQRRIERRMGLHQIDKIGNYVRYLRENPRETELLFKELLIGVTSFFRDPETWEYMRAHVLPELLHSHAKGGVMRAWVPACSTGEEAYSLAMVLSEAMEDAKSSRNLSFQIFATDLDREAIDKARLGSYPANIVADVSPDRLRRFFVQDETGYRVRKEIRETVVFAPQNIITDPPFTKLDILSCRNLLIYLSAELQKRLVPLFHYALNPGGLLFLGSAETVGSFSSLFGTFDAKTRLYRRLETAVGAPPVEFPSSFVAREGVARETDGGEAPDVVRGPAPNLQVLADRVIVQRFAPATVLTSNKGDILYISGRTGKYLEPAVGKANLNIFAMAREGLRVELSGAFATALKDERVVSVRGIKVRSNGAMSTMDLTVQKLNEPKELRGTVMIVMTDVVTAGEEPVAAPPAAATRRVPQNLRLAQIEQELQHALEEAQTTREEMQTSQEELKSTNEELQSTNEELQSTNEELTTSKEEMQSMNEELQTVNQELQSKVDDLARSNNDMRNLLNSTDVATLFLDSELLVRRFTTPTSKIIKLIPTDAGRPITDIATELDYPDLSDDAREVLRTLIFKERTVAARDGRWFSVRIMPYRTLENVIDGIVMTFADMTSSKRMETSLRDQASQLKQMAESLPTLVWGCRPDGASDYLSQQWLLYTGISEAEQLGYAWLDQVHPDDRERVREEWKSAVKATAAFNTEFRIRSSDGTYRWFKSRSVPIRDEQGRVVKWYGTHTDVDDLKHAILDSEKGAERLTALLDWIGKPSALLDERLAILHVNQAAEKALGIRLEKVERKAFFDLFPEGVGTPFEQKLRGATRNRPPASAPLRLECVLRGKPFEALLQASQDGLLLLLRPADATPQGS
jgi:two-component system CheB/CheR fusion protein